MYLNTFALEVYKKCYMLKQLLEKLKRSGNDRSFGTAFVS